MRIRLFLIKGSINKYMKQLERGLGRMEVMYYQIIRGLLKVKKFKIYSLTQNSDHVYVIKMLIVTVL